MAINVEKYFEQKLEFDRKTNPAKTLEQVKADFQQAGVSAEEHYKKWGWAELLSLDTDFDVAQYLADKAALDGKTVDQVIADFKKAGVNPQEHYENWGKGEGLTPVAVGATPGEGEEPGTPNTLTEKLAALAEAQTEEAQFLSNWAEENELESATKTDVEDAVTTAIAGLSAGLSGASLSSSAVLETDTAAQQAAKLSAIRAELAVAVTDAEVDAQKAATAIAKTKDLKQAVDSYLNAFDKAQTAAENADLAGAKVSAIEAAIASLETDLGVDYGDVDSDATKVADLLATVEDANGDVVSYSNKVKQSSLVAAGFTEAAAKEYLAKLSDLASALNAQIAADKKAESTLTAAQSKLEKIKSFEGTDNADKFVADPVPTVDVDPAKTAVDFIVATGTAATESVVYNYVSAAGSLQEAKDNIDTIEALISALETAQQDVADYDVLVKNVEAATKALADEGYAVKVPGVDNLDLDATEDSDIFVISHLVEQADFDGVAGVEFAEVTIDNFGATGQDAIFIAGWTQGESIKAGDNSVLEFFIEQIGDDAVVTFEASEFGSSAKAQEVFVITLAGVKAADLVVDGDFLTLAA